MLIERETHQIAFSLTLPSICKVLGQALLVGGGDVNTRGDGDCGSGWERGSLDLKEWKGAPS